MFGDGGFRVAVVFTGTGDDCSGPGELLVKEKCMYRDDIKQMKNLDSMARDHE